MDNPNLIVYKDFVKRFRKNVVGPVSLNIKTGRITALLGSSGSGKTVLINSIIGATKRFKGEILIDKYNRKKSNSYKVNKMLGYYTQMDFSLYDISAYSFLKQMAFVFGLQNDKIAPEIEKWMRYFDLWHNKDKKLKNYSWGMKNRINLILCFIKSPDIIVMDEPGANLDSYWRNKVKNLLVEYKNQGKTIVITVHNIDEIADIIDDYIILESGKMIFEGSKEELNVYAKYKVFIQDQFDVEDFRDFLTERKIKSFKFDELENSLVVAIERYQEINYLFLYLIKNNLLLKNLVKLPINIESIHKALENQMLNQENEVDQETEE